MFKNMGQEVELGEE